MSLFDCLTDQDKQNIEYWITRYADSESNYIPLNSSLQYILRYWEENKKELYKMLGSNLIHSKAFKYTKSFEEAEEEYSNYFEWNNPFLSAFRTFCGAVRRKNVSFWDSFDSRERYMIDQIESLCDTDSLFYNLYNGDTFILSFEEKSLKIDTGCKISKLLGKIVKTWPNYFSQEDYEEFRIKHSQFTNQNKLVGNLCLSIHPLDYITMSDNEESWDSCMNWRDAGDYRMGTVEMMNSPCIVEAYLTAKEPMTEGESFSWNSKKWRQLFIVTPEVIMGIKPYPYVNNELTGQALKWLKELAQTNCGWGPYSDNLTQIRNHEKVQVSDDSRIIAFDFKTNHMYNDIYSEHPGYVSKKCGNVIKINYSGESECMICGNPLDEEKEVSCQRCNGRYYCCECGDVIYKDNIIFDVSGNHYCSYCADNFLSECTVCGDLINNNDIIAVPIVRKPDEQIDTLFCCWNCFKSNTRFLNFVWPFVKTLDDVDAIDYNNIAEKDHDWLSL